MSGRAEGHTMAEMLVAMTLMLLVLASVTSLLGHTTRLSRRDADRVELQQRARAALDLITRDARSAGAGVDRGPATGRLSEAFAPVWPRRLGRGGDAPRLARATAVTFLAVPDTLAQTTIGDEVAPGATSVTVVPAAHCAPARPACGFAVGTTFGVFDRAGRLSLFSTEQATGVRLAVRALAQPEDVLAPGSTAAELLIRGYEFDAAAGQLRYFDGDSTTQPIIDDVSAFTIRYFDGGAEIPVGALADGPWLGSGDTLFDVDLLRVRRLRFELQLTRGSATAGAIVEVAVRNLADAGSGAS